MTRAGSILLLLVAALAVACAAEAGAERHPHIRNDPRPLFEYVAAADPSYGFNDTGVRLHGTFPAAWTGYVLNLTSQSWLTDADVDRTLWYHQLVVIVPDGGVKHKDTGAMYITGGSNGQSVPKNTSEDIMVTAFLACTGQIVGATLFQVPNQDLTFTADPEHKARGEDDLVAFSWNQYMKHQNRPEWVSLLPMTKSAVKAMDAITTYASSQFGLQLTKFGVAGASKRGWTTWMTGIVDTRVITIIPIVMDMLNFEKGVEHMYRAYGGWTFAFKPYVEQNLTSSIGTQDMTALAAIVDPLQYKEYLTMPKLVVDATGDEFFMPDDDWYWWGQLPGETYRLMCDNAEHSEATGLIELLIGVDAWVISILEGTPRPKFSWTMDTTSGNSTDPFGTGRITLTTTDKPSKVVVRTATTLGDKRRDFRLVKGDTPNDPCHFIPVKIFGGACINPVIWIGETVAPASVSGGVYTYVGDAQLPPSGWRAFLMELYYPGPLGTSFRFTTQVSIIPNTFPYPSCGTGESCRGVLV